MVFPGRFREQLLAEQLDQVSLSFLVDELELRRGGVGANIAFGLGCLGLRPAVGRLSGRRLLGVSRLVDHARCRHRLSSRLRIATPARFLCTTDSDHCQIASFYSGAMDEARDIELYPIVQRLGGVELVVISPNDPVAMLRHTQECREQGHPFASDPSQQLARAGGSRDQGTCRRRELSVHQRIRTTVA